MRHSIKTTKEKRIEQYRKRFSKSQSTFDIIKLFLVLVAVVFGLLLFYFNFIHHSTPIIQNITTTTTTIKQSLLGKIIPELGWMKFYIQLALLLIVFFVLYEMFQFIYSLWKEGTLYENILLLVFVVAICYLLVHNLLKKV